MPIRADQRAELFGIVSTPEIVEICQVNRTTAMRWKAGLARIPYAARELIRHALEGDLPQPAARAWPGWRFGRDGRLYAPDLKRGFSPEDLRALHWLQQQHRYMERLHRAALRAADGDGVVADEPLHSRKPADQVGRN